MGRNTEKIRYRLEFAPRAESDLARLPVRRRRSKKTQAKPMSFLRKCNWLAENAQIIPHEVLQSLPPELEGLCRLHSGDRRILYWVHHGERLIQIARIIPRSGGYRELRW